MYNLLCWGKETQLNGKYQPAKAVSPVSSATSHVPGDVQERQRWTRATSLWLCKSLIFEKSTEGKRRVQFKREAGNSKDANVGTHRPFMGQWAGSLAEALKYRCGEVEWTDRQEGEGTPGKAYTLSNSPLNNQMSSIPIGLGFFCLWRKNKSQFSANFLCYSKRKWIHDVNYCSTHGNKLF